MVNVMSYENVKDELDSIKLEEAKQIIIENNLFDEEYYKRNYPEIAEQTDNLLEYYLLVGYKQSTNPSKFFDNDKYLNTHKGLLENEINPLVYHVLYDKTLQNKTIVSKSKKLSENIKSINELNRQLTQESFDINRKIKLINEKNKILTENLVNKERTGIIYEDAIDNKLHKTKDELTDDDIKTALKVIKNNDLFDEEYYNNKYPWVAEQTSNLLEHYLKEGYKKGMNPSESFDNDYYLSYPDVKKSNMNPLIYYALYDIYKGRRTTNKMTSEDIESAVRLINENDLFDEKYYYKQYPQLQKTSLDPLGHYLKEGYKLNLNPTKTFNTYYYKQKYLKNEDINPLIHYANIGMKNNYNTHREYSDEDMEDCINTIYNSNTFDDEYYMQQNRDIKGSTKELIKHYVTIGTDEGKNPNEHFDTRYYTSEYPESLCDINPYYNYLTVGKQEGRSPIITKEIIEQEDKIKEKYEHMAEVIEQSDLFDEKYYLNKYPDVKYCLETPAYHYVSRGYKEGKNPSSYFDNNYYLYKYDNLDNPTINPLYHYITVGQDKNNTCKYFLRDIDKQNYKELIDEDVLSKEYTIYGTDAPSVSILILNRNGEDYLTKLLNSLIEFTDYPNYEIIIIDNDSVDNSLKIIDKYTEVLPIRIHKNQLNKSYSEAYNEVVKQAKGDYLVFMDNDIELLDGWLNHLMDVGLKDDAGAVGARLVYPDTTASNYNADKSYKIQHEGIKFKEYKGLIIPYNYRNGRPYIYGDDVIRQVVAVTGSLMLLKKDIFNEVGGFDEEFNFGLESVDLCLRLNEEGYHNYYTSRAVAYHYEFASIEKTINGLLINRDSRNKKYYAHKWNNFLKKQLLQDKLDKKLFYSENELKITFIVSQRGEHIVEGDYFIANGLSNQLEKLGYKVEFLSRKQDKDNWYNIDSDVLISCIEDYDINKIKTNNNLLINIAWILDSFETWTKQEFFESFDIILSSNSQGIHHIMENTGYSPILFPEATNTDLYNDEVEPAEEYFCDYCFAGSSEKHEENITSVIYPEDLPYEFNIYGVGWGYSKLSEYYKGFVKHDLMPRVYASTKIVIDDTSEQGNIPSQVNNRVFDAIACGRLVVSNCKHGLKELFGDKVPTFNSKESLEQLIIEYLNNPDKRRAKVSELRSIVLSNHTYKQRAKELMDILRNFIVSDKVMIKIPAPSNWEKMGWGDYHFAVQLQKEFNKQGYISKIQFYNDWDKYKDAVYDIVLVLRGLYEYKPKPIHYNIMWNLSHPDMVSFGEFNSYNQVYIASYYWADKIKSLVDVDVEGLLHCTNVSRFHREYDEKYDTELLFVGNARFVYRKILHDLLPSKYHLDVYGHQWEGLLDDKYIVDEYIPNEELYKAYSSTKVLLNDHWKDMREKGFISNRIFDGLACGAVIVTDHVKGLEDVFSSDDIIIYDKKEELEDKIEEALHRNPVNPNVVSEHTFTNRVETIIEDYEKKFKK